MNSDPWFLATIRISSTSGRFMGIHDHILASKLIGKQTPPECGRSYFMLLEVVVYMELKL